jgi:hypothetical protein
LPLLILCSVLTVAAGCGDNLPAETGEAGHGGGKAGQGGGKAGHGGSAGSAGHGNGGAGTGGVAVTGTAGIGGGAGAGTGGNATAGHGGNATAGAGGNATTGTGGNATTGTGGNATTGTGGNATAGTGGNATTGTGGNATAGAGGNATTGTGGNATTGTGGNATTGTGGNVTTGVAGGAGQAPGGAAGTAVGGAGGSAPVSCAANPCSASAICADTATGFACTCNAGFTGDGITCNACATCGVGKYQSAACTATTNTVCGACGPHCDACGSASVCTTCAAGYALAGNVCLPVAASCRSIHLSNPSLPDGVYQLDPDGAGPGTPFLAFCDMTSDGGGWMKILQYTTAAYTPTADAVGNIAVAGVPAMAKLADADVNKLSSLALMREYRIKGDISPKKLFMKTTAPWDDPARGHGLILTGTGFACEDVTNCAYVAVTTPAGRPTIDSNDWRPSSIGDWNDLHRYFTDYSGTPNCWITNSFTQRCYGTGNSAGHALIPYLVIWTRELPLDDEALATYRLDEGTGDVMSDGSGNGFGATSVAGSWLASGHTGAAYQGAFRTDAALPVSNAITISAWVRRDGTGLGSPRIVSFPADALELLDVNHGNALGIYVPGVGVQTSSLTSFGTGFHHVAISAGLGALTVYYDAVPVYAVPTGISLGGRMTVGARSDGAEAWVGAFDQVRVFDRALTPAEIARLAAE